MKLDPPAWRRSSRCGDAGSCVEVAVLGTTVGMRDSKLEVSPVLRFSPEAWRSFVRAAANGEFDHS